MNFNLIQTDPSTSARAGSFITDHGQPSGRDPLPNFYVRSKNKKNLKIQNFKQWLALWEKAKEKCIPRKYAFKYPLPTFKTNKRDLSKLI